MTKNLRASFIIQGNFVIEEIKMYELNILNIKKHYPGSEIILSTWEGNEFISDLPADKFVFSKDPGALPPIRKGSTLLNNINRQIISSQSGLKEASYDIAVKIRSDMQIVAKGIEKFFNPFSNKITILNLFTLDPHSIERFFYHFSDWIQIGKTHVLVELWSPPLFPPSWSDYYRENGNIKGNIFEKKFNSKLAVEQYIWTQYAKNQGYITPEFLLSDTLPIRKESFKFLYENINIVELSDIGLRLKKHHKACVSIKKGLNS